MTSSPAAGTPTGEGVSIYATRDDERAAREIAENLWLHYRRKALVMAVRDWNQAHPERLLRTKDRYVVIAEPRRAAS